MLRYFVADIHLSDKQPEISVSFIRFLQQLPNYSELYILGDLFDAWVGDDIQTELHNDIAHQLKSLSRRGIRTFFIQGNRDFLLRKSYAKKCAMTILPEIYVLKQGDKNILILHGDQLCTDDAAYQRFRRIVHNRLWQNCFLLLPAIFRQYIARRLRNRSRERNSQKADDVMDVNAQAVNDIMTKYRADILIHGHTHRPASYQFEYQGKQLQRFVLGAWHDNGDYVVAGERLALVTLETDCSE
ncbi:UDP-2,3-diacylglucosamine diphosphatase [Utexia brackfieldae]|uniref:UDP-2,3-diacylglucosamine diphosphatase n=1 Tax=Utexia brackfieldae TaxID=3074108 RepID=UPI00370DBB71